MKRFFCMVLVLVTLVGVISVPAFAATYSVGTYEVDSNIGINVRKGAGTKYSVVGAAKDNTAFTVSKISGEWGYTSGIKCTNGTKSGWVCLSYCSPQNTERANFPIGTYVVDPNSIGSNVRKGAGTKYSVVGGARAGTIFTVSKVNGDWGYSSSIKCVDGRTRSGWICLSYCVKDDGSSNKITTSQTVTSNKITYNFTSTRTTYTKSNSVNLTVNGVKIPVGSTFYTYTSNGKNKTTAGKGSSIYAKVGSKYVNMNGWQCCAYARYIQYLMYGSQEFKNNKFVDVNGARGRATAAKIEKWVKEAGVGAHIRSSCPHSMIVIGINDNGFYYTDCNMHGSNRIEVGYYTWKDFAKSNFKNIEYICYYKA